MFFVGDGVARDLADRGDELGLVDQVEPGAGREVADAVPGDHDVVGAAELDLLDLSGRVGR